MNLFDVLGVLGLAAISIGIGLIYIPAGIIAAGVSLVVIAFVGSAARARMEKS